MGKLLERLDLAEKARKTEIRGDRNFLTALKRKSKFGPN
jgi:hypothetical protein